MPSATYTTGPVYNGNAATLTVAADGQITAATGIVLLSPAVIIQAENLSQTLDTIVRMRIYSIDTATGAKTKVFDTSVQPLDALTEVQFFYEFTDADEGFKYEVVTSTNNAEFTQFSVWGVAITAGTTVVTAINAAHRMLQEEMTVFV